MSHTRRDLVLKAGGALAVAGLCGCPTSAPLHSHGMAGASASGLGASSGHHGEPSAPIVSRRAILADAPPADVARARELVVRDAVEALIVSHPVNVYYLTDFWPVTSRMRYHDAITVALTRDAQRPLALVTGEFTWYYLMSDARYRYSLEVFLCGAPPDPERAASEWQGGIKNDLRSRVFPDAGLAPVSDREQQRARNVERAVRAHELALDRERALGRALGWLELRGARIATDSAAGRAWTERNGAHLTFVEADPLLTRARLIKSAREAVLARTAATANVEAALASVAAVRRGASLDDFRRHIFSEAARRGNRGVFMVVDDVSEEGGSDTLREGKAFMFDAVSAGAGAARQSG